LLHLYCCPLHFCTAVLQNTLYELSLTKAGLPTKPEDVPEPAEAAGGGGEEEA